MQSIVFAFLVCTQLSAQDVSEAHRVIDTLASKAYWGRGYVRGGHTKAADFIGRRFAQLHLQKFADSYFQYFSFDINIFDNNIKARSKKKLIVGKDYIPAADCPAFKGRLYLKRYDSTAAMNPHDIGLVDKKKRKNTQGHTLVFEDHKLTHTFAQRQSKYVKLTLLDTARLKLGNHIKLHIKPSLKRVQSQNVIGYVKGSVDTALIVCAHYDHLGGIGRQCYFPGANDNASGVAMLLQLAAHYSKVQPHYTMVFIAFGAEEVGLVGSEYYVNHPLLPLEKTKFVLNLDLMGSGLEGITVVNGTVFEKEFKRLSELNDAAHYVKAVRPRGKAANSDHYHFSERGIKSFFIYSLGEITAYHDIDDTAAAVPLTKFAEMYRLIVEFLDL